MLDDDSGEAEDKFADWNLGPHVATTMDANGMFSHKTVLVLGAGASFEVGLPVGETLKGNISSSLEVERVMANGHSFLRVKDSLIEKSLSYQADKGEDGLTLNSLLDACAQISAALPLARSIDNFLHSHSGSRAIELCGKLGIVRSILIAESASRMALVGGVARLDFRRLDGTWYNRFANLLFDVNYEEFQERLKKLTVIIFNYDRCFERFMFDAITTHYGVPAEEAARVVNSMAIYHPYGTVGNLEWMGNQPQSQFGEQVQEDRLLELAKNIKTYTEGVDRASGEIQAIHKAIRQAETIVFLGFGYIPLNMQLLKPSTNSEHRENSKKKIYYGTAKGLSKEDMLIVAHDVRNLVHTGSVATKIENNELTCAKLFTEYAFSLGAS